LINKIKYSSKDLTIFTCDWRSYSERNGAKTEQKPDRLRSSGRTDDVEGDWPKQGDEAAVEQTHDQRKYYQSLKNVTLKEEKQFIEILDCYPKYHANWKLKFLIIYS
jgi:hypothetical protein